MNSDVKCEKKDKNNVDPKAGMDYNSDSNKKKIYS